MPDLNFDQRKVVATFFANIAVGWFIAGVVTPFLARPESSLELVSRAVWGFFMTYIFLNVALRFIKEGK